MYDIKKRNIWKETEIKDIFKWREKVLEKDASKRKELFLVMKSAMVFKEIVKLVPEADFAEIKKRRGGKLRFPIYVNEKNKTAEIEALELSVRSSNCLHRAGFKTIGELVESINGSEDLKKIRNCGAKSMDEIMEQLFCYQYRQLENDKKIKYIKRVLELNS